MHPRLIALKETGRLVREVMQRERVTLHLFGSPEASAAYKTFTRPHRRFKIIKANTFGVALADLPSLVGKPFDIPALKDFRYYHGRSLRLGYAFREIAPLDHIEAMMDIHRSVPARQGRPMAAMYLDETAVRDYCGRSGPYFGVFDKNGKLVAYCHAPILGDVFIFSRIIGHKTADPVMYLLVAETMLYMARRAERFGFPKRAMFDMFIGARDGLRTFKRHCGFAPYRVRWHYETP